MDLHGKCIILTGATGGIGSALCAGLVEAGATVVAVGRIEETLRRQAAAHALGASSRWSPIWPASPVVRCCWHVRMRCARHRRCWCLRMRKATLDCCRTKIRWH